MKTIYLCAILLFLSGAFGQSKLYGQESGSKGDTNFAKLSIKLVKAVKNDADAKPMKEKIANVSVDELAMSLNTEGKRKAFWLNIYNAYVQILLEEKPERMETRNDKFGYNFFSSSQVTIAGHELSLDDIEHGLIRHSKMKISMGFLNKIGWFTEDFEKRLRWKELDNRIHFALNCGAKSCPKIAIYTPDRVNEQLDKSAKQYLKKSTDYNPEQNTVAVTSLMNWYRGDFDGKDGIVPFLKKYEVIPEDANPSVSFKDYDWTVDLGNYKEI